jgi:hypothetical protein
VATVDTVVIPMPIPITITLMVVDTITGMRKDGIPQVLVGMVAQVGIMRMDMVGAGMVV